MNHEVIVTCAVTGAGDTVGKHPAIPVTPKQIAEAAIEAAKAGATVAHCHVRDPKTGRGSRDPGLYREVVDRIRSSGTDVIINLTAGMGGDLEIGPGEDPMRFGANTDLVGGLTRLAGGGLGVAALHGVGRGLRVALRLLIGGAPEGLGQLLEIFARLMLLRRRHPAGFGALGQLTQLRADGADVGLTHRLGRLLHLWRGLIA